MFSASSGILDWSGLETLGRLAHFFGSKSLETEYELFHEHDKLYFAKGPQ